MQQFLAYFVDQLDKAGVAFTILAPERLSVVRARERSDDEEKAAPAEPEEEEPNPASGAAPARRRDRYGR